MCLVVRKPAFRICENKDADQLRGNREADQRLCFRYTDSTIPLLSKSEISSFQPSAVTAQHSLCPTWSETPNTGFLTTRLLLNRYKLQIILISENYNSESTARKIQKKTCSNHPPAFLKVSKYVHVIYLKKMICLC